jgi:hypothetical protein
MATFSNAISLINLSSAASSARGWSRALEEEMKRRGGGYDYIAGAWRGTYDEDPALTE